MGAPLFTACNDTVTSSPALNEVRSQPSWLMLVGFWVSTAQFLTLPLSSFTSNFRKQCGLDHTHSVTVPFNVMTLSSKLALPWCASSGMDTSRRTAARNAAGILFVIDPSHLHGDVRIIISLVYLHANKFPS